MISLCIRCVGDFGSGSISNFWGNFNSGGLFIGVANSSTSYTYWTTTVANNFSSEDEVALDTKSSVNFTIMDDMANPLYSTKVLGYGAKTSNVAKAAGVLKGVGNVLGVGVDVYQ